MITSSHPKPIMVLRLLASLVFLSALVVSPVQAERGATHPGVIHIDRDKVSPGDILIRGVAVGGGNCEVDPFEVTTISPNGGQTRWFAISIDDQCQVKVDAKWEGELAEGPKGVVEPLQRLLAQQSDPVPEEASQTVGQKLLPMTITSTRTSSQEIYSYPYQGTDKLTSKIGTLTWTYDGSSAQTSSQSGSCTGSNYGSFSWVVDSCQTLSHSDGPGTTVYRTGQGNYHCDPTSAFPCNLMGGYYHSLTDHEEGTNSGSSVCTYSWSGNVYFSVTRAILQGCS